MKKKTPIIIEMTEMIAINLSSSLRRGVSSESAEAARLAI